MLSKSKVKYIQTLGQKKFREQEGMFIAEGPKLIDELLGAAPAHIIALYALQDWIDTIAALPHHIEVHAIPEADLAKISQLTTPNKVVALVKQFDTATVPAAAGKLILVLDDIRDPGNLGTIIRIADWFGIQEVVCSLTSADVYNPKVVQSTMGSIARVHVTYTALPEWLIHNKGEKTYAAMLAGKNVESIGKLTSGIIIIGNEAQGISDEVAALVTEKITIVRKGQAESLNAAVATGIILSQLC